MTIGRSLQVSLYLAACLLIIDRAAADLNFEVG